MVLPIFSAQRVLAYLPLTLFFPLGWMYAGVFLFLGIWLFSMQASATWKITGHRIYTHAMFAPVLLFTVYTACIAIFLPRNNFLSSFLHYQLYWALLIFASLTPGIWQRQMLQSFLWGAYGGATLFYLHGLGVLPDISLLKSYRIYQGGKSILLGILLAIAASWKLAKILQSLRAPSSRLWWDVFGGFYLLGALTLFAHTRTGVLIFIVVAGLLILKTFSWKKRVLLVIASFLLCIMTWQYALQASPPASCIVHQMQENALQKFLNRGICTVQDFEKFRQGQAISDDGMRLELFSLTAQLIYEKPWGHGIGKWRSVYAQRAQGLVSQAMITPHNDYLLYAMELGLAGCLLLFCMIACQISCIRRSAMPDWLLIVSGAMVLATAFNAFLRDAIYGMAGMILLAPAMAGLSAKPLVSQEINSP